MICLEEEQSFDLYVPLEKANLPFLDMNSPQLTSFEPSHNKYAKSQLLETLEIWRSISPRTSKGIGASHITANWFPGAARHDEENLPSDATISRML